VSPAVEGGVVPVWVPLVAAKTRKGVAIVLLLLQNATSVPVAEKFDADPPENVKEKGSYL
jgi:hypothetical protein